MTYQKFNGAIALATNSPGAPTGYGVQAEYLVPRLLRHGIKTAVLSNYGLEAKKDKIVTPYGKAEHYPKGHALYSEDVIPLWYEDFMRNTPGRPGAVMTLFDVWVYNKLKFDGNIISWVPLDHVTMPPAVAHFLKRGNVTPIAMSPHGQRQMKRDLNMDSVYIPHGVDTSVFKPTAKIGGVATRKFMGVPEDAFLVTMVAANKANGFIHRKALAEQLVAFATLQKKHPDAYLYLHMTARKTFGGFDLSALLPAVGLSPESVIIADEEQLRFGYSQKQLAAFYTASDVLLSASYGEGFGVPLIEAQACGTPVITGNWTAMPDLVAETSYLVNGQPFWDEPQMAFWHIPHIESLVHALEMAYEERRGEDRISIEFAQDFAVERVWNNYWLPFWEGYFGRLRDSG
jgi:glycosyltransferase involved in cell wall biosynthesis